MTGQSFLIPLAMICKVAESAEQNAGVIKPHFGGSTFPSHLPGGWVVVVVVGVEVEEEVSTQVWQRKGH
jgi:hypothetical protein